MGGNRNKGNNKRQPSPTASRDTKASEKGQQSMKDTPQSEESSDIELQNILSNRQQRKQKQVPQTEKQQAKNSAALEMEIVKDTFSSSTSTNVPPVSTPHSSTLQQKVPASAKKNTQAGNPSTSGQDQHNENDQQTEMELDQQDDQPPESGPANNHAGANKNTNEDEDSKNILELKKLIAVIHLDYILGTYLEKERAVAKKLKNRKGFIYAKVIPPKKCVKVFFNKELTFDKLLKEEFRWTDKDDEELSKFNSLSELRPPTEEEKIDEKDRTIQVFDIPLYLKQRRIKTSFETLGDIEKISTKAIGLYQQAYITFKEKKLVEKFFNIWSHNIYEEIVRIIPLSLSREQRD